MCYQNPTVWYEVTVRGIATSLTNAVWSITITQLLRFKFQFRLQLHRQTFIRSFKRPCFKLIAQVSIFFSFGLAGFNSNQFQCSLATSVFLGMSVDITARWLWESHLLSTRRPCIKSFCVEPQERSKIGRSEEYFLFNVLEGFRKSQGLWIVSSL